MVIMRDYVGERAQTPIVHVRRRDGDVAQRRRFEFPCIGRTPRHPSARCIAACIAEAVVPKTEIRKKRSAMSVETIRPPPPTRRIILAGKQRETSLLFLCQHGLTARGTIKFRVGGDERQ